jgi:hypothetical protein
MLISSSTIDFRLPIDLFIASDMLVADILVELSTIDATGCNGFSTGLTLVGVVV